MKIFHKIIFTSFWWACSLVGRLPDKVRYGPLKRFTKFILYDVVGYRREVVQNNLAHSFPELSTKERAKIEEDFYAHLAEIFIDTISLAAIPRANILDRMQYTGIEEHEKQIAGQSWISAMSHFGSWELTINYNCHTNNRVLAVYRPLHSKFFDSFYHKARSRFGTEPVAMNDIYKEVIRTKSKGTTPVTVALIADQTPPFHESKHWYRFFGQATPFFAGMEKMATRFHLPVYFTNIRQVSPQHYEVTFEQIYDGTEQLPEHEITERYVRKLEEMIRVSPHLWMWSHRRWKHKMPEHEQTYTSIKEKTALNES